MPYVQLQIWRVPARAVIASVAAAGAQVRRLRRRDAVTFAKLLGTASSQFVPWAATPTRWAMLSCWRERPASVTLRHAAEAATLSLLPLRSRGAWDGIEPFGNADGTSQWDGPLVVLTRSTLRLRKAHSFYATVPPIAAELAAADGCRLALGIGEAPLLRQGTISVWDSIDAMTAFAHHAPAHVRAVTATPAQGWYAEELFTRFGLVAATGSVDGQTIG
jgi:hypothetical protein